MLSRFRVKNSRSFAEHQEINFRAGAVKRKSFHVNSMLDGNLDLLRLCLIYGANASGKTNFIRAIRDAQRMVISDVPKILFFPHKLSKELTKTPVEMLVEFVHTGTHLRFEFHFNEKRIVFEELTELNGTDETILFTRRDNITEFPGFQVNEEGEQFLNFVAKATAENNLLLRELFVRQVSAETYAECSRKAYDWFHNVLTIVEPDWIDDQLEAKIRSNERFRNTLATLIASADTGIRDIQMTTSKVDGSMKWISDRPDSDFPFVIPIEGCKHGTYVERSTENDHTVGWITTLRKDRDGDVVPFFMPDESHGTQRMFDLFPMAMGSGHQRVYLIDELDTGLHPAIVRRFIEAFLDSKVSASNQLIATTHETSILTQELIRRDEVWVVEKNASGSSSFNSLESFKVRHDLDLQRAYLRGMFGGYPHSTSTGWALAEGSEWWASDSEEVATQNE